MTAQIWGPGNFHNLVNAIRRFVPNAATVHTHSFGSKMDQRVEVQNAEGTADMMSPDVLFQNEAVKICAVILHPSVEGDTHASKESTRVSVLYICELAEVVGKFDPKKALAKGLKPGPKYGKLQRGESVLSDDGTQQVNPEEVLSPSSPGPIMMLVDCPSLHYLNALNSTPRLQMYYSGSRKHVNCIVHLSPPSVTKHEGYRKWMANFKDAHHLMAGRDRMNPQFPILKSSAFQLSKLNYMCPKVFPVTGYLPAQDGEMTITEVRSLSSSPLPSPSSFR
ncbi:hypothetical protein KP509_1Z268100 [Ceratopteris richardii]|nr:hypothetical protein KP509_1Z268100 [Ceratopteris richardii]